MSNRPLENPSSQQRASNDNANENVEDMPELMTILSDRNVLRRVMIDSINSLSPQRQQQQQQAVQQQNINDSDNEDGARTTSARSSNELNLGNDRLIPENDSDEENDNEINNNIVERGNGGEAAISFVFESDVPLHLTEGLLTSVLNSVQQQINSAAHQGQRQQDSTPSTSSSSSSSPSSSSPTSNNSWEDNPATAGTLHGVESDGIRIRVPLHYLESSATSSGAPTANAEQLTQIRGEEQEIRNRLRAEATSETTTTSTQVTPEVNPPLRPEPLFSAEMRQQRMERERVQRHDRDRDRERPIQMPPPIPMPQNRQRQNAAHGNNTTAQRGDDPVSLLDPFQMLQNLMQTVDNGTLDVRRMQQNNHQNAPFGGIFENASAQPQCDHNIRKVYDTIYDVPICVCNQCEDAIIAPSDQNEYTAKALKYPLSMQRDNRFQELFDLHAEHITVTENLQELLQKQRALFLRLYEWENRYSDHTPINYSAQNNPCYRELSRSVDRYVNALQAFSNVSQEMTLAHRRRFVKTVYRTFPKNKAFFQSEMRYEICKAQPNPMLMPGIDALPDCTVCGKAADVRLHAHTQRYENRRIPPTALRNDAVEQIPVRQCVCKNFLMCLDCLLDWFWESSSRLQKSFAQCPTCKAEFKLEDILRVCVSHGHPTSATTDSSSSSSSSPAR